MTATRKKPARAKKAGPGDAPPPPRKTARTAWLKALKLDDEARDVVIAAIDELSAVRADVDGERARIVEAAASLLERGDDQKTLDAALRKARAEERAGKKRALVLKRIHRALDDDQRRLLAVLVRAGLLPL